MTPATDWKETLSEGEAERFERHAETIRELQRKQARGGSTSRALHAKPNAGLEAELTVLPDLPEHARQGLFASPATYRAYVRFSNGAGKRQADRKPDVRGVAIKVVGVPGKKIIPGMEDKKTQDFLMIRTPSTPFANADDFVALLRAADNPLLLLPRIIGHFGFGRGLGLLKQLASGLSAPLTPLASTRYFSALPIKFGPHAVHYAIKPHDPSGPLSKKSGSAEQLGEELAATLRERCVSYDLQVQFYVDAAKTPIEDGSVEWKESDALYHAAHGKGRTAGAGGWIVARVPGVLRDPREPHDEAAACHQRDLRLRDDVPEAVRRARPIAAPSSSTRPSRPPRERFPAYKAQRPSDAGRSPRADPPHRSARDREPLPAPAQARLRGRRHHRDPRAPRRRGGHGGGDRRRRQGPRADGRRPRPHARHDARRHLRRRARAQEVGRPAEAASPICWP
jgi:hypothetical protein